MGEGPAGEHVLVIGMMGVGKTTTGGRVARLMRRPFHDSDAEIFERTGKSVPEIFATRGEAAFRAEEKAVLARAIGSGVPSVIAVAGGAVVDPDSRRRIRDGGVAIWLRAQPATLADRVGSGAGRPLLEHDPAATLALLDSLRRPLYATLADAAFDVDSLQPGEVAGRVWRAANRFLAAERRCGGSRSVAGRWSGPAWP